MLMAAVLGMLLLLARGVQMEQRDLCARAVREEDVRLVRKDAISRRVQAMHQLVHHVHPRRHARRALELMRKIPVLYEQAAVYLHHDLPHDCVRNEPKQRRQFATLAVDFEQRDLAAREALPAVRVPILVVEDNSRGKIGTQSLPLASERAIECLDAAVRRTLEHVRLESGIAIAADGEYMTRRCGEELRWITDWLASLPASVAHAFQLGACDSVRPAGVPPVLEVAAKHELSARILHCERLAVCSIIEVVSRRGELVTTIGGAAESAHGYSRQ